MKERKNKTDFIAFRVTKIKKRMLKKEAQKQGLYISELMERMVDNYFRSK